MDKPLTLTLTPEALEKKRTIKKFDDITKEGYSNQPKNVIRINYTRIRLTPALDELTKALRGTDKRRIYNALQSLNDAVNVWLEFNDYIQVPCFCITTNQNIFIKPRLAAAAAARGGRKKSVRKGKKTTTKRKLRKGKSKKSRKSVRRYKKFSNKYKY